MVHAKGFRCRTCGKTHPFTPYVYAHADEPLTHTCNQCGAEHSILRLKVNLIKAGYSFPPVAKPTITISETGGVQLNTSNPEVIDKLWALVDQFRDARKEQP